MLQAKREISLTYVCVFLSQRCTAKKASEERSKLPQGRKSTGTSYWPHCCPTIHMLTNPFSSKTTVEGKISHLRRKC